jgi:hypothetical protein
MSNYFPSTDDEPKPVGKYFKPRENGLYLLRILTPMLAYDMAWKAQKPVRRELDYEWSPADYDADGKFGPSPPKRAWACAIWLHNFKPELKPGQHGIGQPVSQVQVWEITQASIRAALSKLGQDEDWSDPTAYDIKLTRENGKNDLPQYTVSTSLPKPLPDPAIQEWDALTEFGGFDINRLLTGGDPFKA